MFIFQRKLLFSFLISLTVFLTGCSTQNIRVKKEVTLIEETRDFTTYKFSVNEETDELILTTGDADIDEDLVSRGILAAVRAGTNNGSSETPVIFRGCPDAPTLRNEGVEPDQPFVFSVVMDEFRPAGEIFLIEAFDSGVRAWLSRRVVQSQAFANLIVNSMRKFLFDRWYKDFIYDEEGVALRDCVLSKVATTLAEEIEGLAEGEWAVAAFSGRIRDFELGKKVNGVDLIGKESFDDVKLIGSLYTFITRVRQDSQGEYEYIITAIPAVPSAACPILNFELYNLPEVTKMGNREAEMGEENKDELNECTNCRNGSCLR